MRALGPGSVSSLLKLVLDVIYFVLWAIVGGFALLAFAALLLPSDMGLPRGSPIPGPVLAAGLFAAAIYLSVVLLIVDLVRRIFLTLIAGDPFDPRNVRRLRWIGFALAGLELLSYTVNVFPWIFHDWLRWQHSMFNPTAWFAVLVVFVLAEVFREGARLRSEAELTI
jgi:Protein of unknown function (DUF2975)